MLSCLSVTKDADRDGDVKAPVAEPEIHMESDINSASGLCGVPFLTLILPWFVCYFTHVPMHFILFVEST